ncbi:hypothetical protein JCM6292_788 [Bacteroides pyogenes JCM 6292]|uniref:Lin1244/Lin1753-like N-terminal domain-containing protein n=2 Tax=Bacteroides pyogenes TaxID=310300 RepID=W4PEG2_9BACE|nr:Lin1244/Lin1753 domain-containing protein [Bacteroides pyogenes]GAE14625.1 hypothetical protein JCM6292_788 [Bacteroides pyogenes JCM 6292]GAE18201.1 hypothetical protein JCM6294_1070 [Bacteroides pyogenes DSM 20611 = JCM 6294]
MKDTFYFQHDYNARNDPKLQDVLINLGVEGIGVFWCIIEQLYEQGGKLPLRSCKSIAFALHVDYNKVESLVHDYGLFKNDGVNMWSDSVLKRLDKRKDISDKRKQAAIARWKQNLENQALQPQSANDKQTTNNPNVLQMQNTSNANAGHKEKERKEKNNISTNVDTSTCVDAPEQKRDFSIDYSRLLAAWKEHCPSFPQPRSLADDDKRKIRQRFGEMMTAKDPETAYQRIKEIFQTINASDFCKKGKWCTFRWIFTNATNWRKVEDGNYNDLPGGQNSKRANEEW